MWTFFYTSQASAALIIIHENGMFVPRQINAPNHLLGAKIEAQPTRFAFTGVEHYTRCHDMFAGSHRLIFRQSCPESRTPTITIVNKFRRKENISICGFLSGLAKLELFQDRKQCNAGAPAELFRDGFSVSRYIFPAECLLSAREKASHNS